MNLPRLLHIAAVLVLVTLVNSSCSEEYCIKGNSSVTNYEGNNIYITLRDGGENTVVKFDSAEICHGVFEFNGILDTSMMAQIVVGGMNMPIVLESSKIEVSFSDEGNSIRGGLNDNLYKFIRDEERLESEIENVRYDLVCRRMNGETTSGKSTKKLDHLMQQLDELWVKFIIDNKNNIMGPEFFARYTDQYSYPLITPQIEKIVKHAPDAFLTDPRVALYLHSAMMNMRVFSDDFFNDGNYMDNAVISTMFGPSKPKRKK